MLEPIFGNKNIERILFYLLINEASYATQLATNFGEALSPFQKALDRLEAGGIIVSFLEGKTRIYEFNPRYPFLEELKNLLMKAFNFLPKDFKDYYLKPKVRKRPRRRGKPL